MATRTIQVQPKTLQGNITNYDTQFIIENFVGLDGNVILQADIGDTNDVLYGTFDPNAPREEAFSAKIIGNSGTTVTFQCTRGLIGKYPYSTGGIPYPHDAGTKVVFSNNPNLFNKFIAKDNDSVVTGNIQVPTPATNDSVVPKEYVDDGDTFLQDQIDNDVVKNTGNETVAGVKTFSSPPIVPAPTTDFQAATKKYADDLAIAGAPDASVTAKGIVQIADSTNVNNGDRTGTTGAILVVSPDILKQKTNEIENNINTSIVNIDSDTDQTQTTQNSSVAVGEIDATTKKNLLAQSFVPTKTGIAGVRLWKASDTGTFTGTVKIALQADTTGSPSGSDLASFTITNTAWLKLTAGSEFGIRFNSEYNSLGTSSTYWIVITSSTSDNSNHPNLGINTAGGYSNGQAKYKNTTDGWVAITGQDLYFKTIQGLVSKLVKTKTDGLIPSLTQGYGFIDISNSTVNQNYTGTSSQTTVLYSKQIEGGLVNANSGIKINMIGRLLLSSTNFQPTAKFEIRYNGTPIISDQINTQSGTDGINGTGGYNVMRYTIIIKNQASMTSQSSKLFADCNVASGYTGTTVNYYRQQSNTSTVDFSQPGLLEIVAISTANGGASNSTETFYGCSVEKIS